MVHFMLGKWTVCVINNTWLKTIMYLGCWLSRIFNTEVHITSRQELFWFNKIKKIQTNISDVQRVVWEKQGWTHQDMEVPSFNIQNATFGPSGTKLWRLFCERQCKIFSKLFTTGKISPFSGFHLQPFSLIAAPCYSSSSIRSSGITLETIC